MKRIICIIFGLLLASTVYADYWVGQQFMKAGSWFSNFCPSRVYPGKIYIWSNDFGLAIATEDGSSIVYLDQIKDTPFEWDNISYFYDFISNQNVFIASEYIDPPFSYQEWLTMDGGDTWILRKNDSIINISDNDEIYYEHYNFDGDILTDQTVLKTSNFFITSDTIINYSIENNYPIEFRLAENNLLAIKNKNESEYELDFISLAPLQVQTKTLDKTYDDFLLDSKNSNRIYFLLREQDSDKLVYTNDFFTTTQEIFNFGNSFERRYFVMYYLSNLVLMQELRFESVKISRTYYLSIDDGMTWKKNDYLCSFASYIGSFYVSYLYPNTLVASLWHGWFNTNLGLIDLTAENITCFLNEGKNQYANFYFCGGFSPSLIFQEFQTCQGWQKYHFNIDDYSLAEFNTPPGDFYINHGDPNIYSTLNYAEDAVYMTCDGGATYTNYARNVNCAEADKDCLLNAATYSSPWSDDPVTVATPKIGCYLLYSRDYGVNWKCLENRNSVSTLTFDPDTKTVWYFTVRYSNLFEVFNIDYHEDRLDTIKAIEIELPELVQYLSLKKCTLTKDKCFLVIANYLIIKSCDYFNTYELIMPKTSTGEYFEIRGGYWATTYHNDQLELYCQSDNFDGLWMSKDLGSTWNHVDVYNQEGIVPDSLVSTYIDGLYFYPGVSDWCINTYTILYRVTENPIDGYLYDFKIIYYNNAIEINNRYSLNKLSLFSLSGSLVRAFDIKAGQSSIPWFGTDNNGNQLPSGIYFARAEDVQGNAATTKVVLVR
jgi:hypothetical protein